MESQPQNPEFRNNPENFHPCTCQLVPYAGYWLDYEKPVHSFMLMPHNMSAMVCTDY